MESQIQEHREQAITDIINSLIADPETPVTLKNGTKWTLEELLYERLNLTNEDADAYIRSQQENGCDLLSRSIGFNLSGVLNLSI